MCVQDKSKEFYKQIYKKHSDFIWIYLQSLYIDEHEYKSDNIRLPAIKVRIALLQHINMNNIIEILYFIFRCVVP